MYGSTYMKSKKYKERLRVQRGLAACGHKETSMGNRYAVSCAGDDMGAFTWLNESVFWFIIPKSYPNKAEQNVCQGL